jgi:hypothetical protein
MILTEVRVTDGLTQPLEQFGERAPKMLDTILKITGYRYRKYINKDYLSGQMLSRRTGSLAASTIVGKKKGGGHIYLVGQKSKGYASRGAVVVTKLANIYEHSGGYVIEPKKAKCLVFQGPDGLVFVKRVEGKARPFMSQSASSFPWADTFNRTSDDVIAKELKKLGMTTLGGQA